MKALALAVTAVLASGCVTAQVTVPPAQVSELERSLTGQGRFLRVSMYATPFYGDATKRLLTSVPPELVRYLDDTAGKPINPGPVERTYPVGTKVTITKVEFPSSWVMAERVLYTPRTLVWLYLEVAGAPRRAPPVVLVLRPGLKTDKELLAELDRHLTRDDPAPLLEGFSEAVRDAVKAKNAVVEMPAEALEMAWGFPESKRIELVEQQRKETWRWAGGARTAVLVDGRVTELK